MLTLVSGRDAIERSFGTKFRRGEIPLSADGADSVFAIGAALVKLLKVVFKQ